MKKTIVILLSTMAICMELIAFKMRMPIYQHLELMVDSIDSHSEWNCIYASKGDTTYRILTNENSYYPNTRIQDILELTDDSIVVGEAYEFWLSDIGQSNQLQDGFYLPIDYTGGLAYFNNRHVDRNTVTCYCANLLGLRINDLSSKIKQFSSQPTEFGLIPGVYQSEDGKIRLEVSCDALTLYTQDSYKEVAGKYLWTSNYNIYNSHDNLYVAYPMAIKLSDGYWTSRYIDDKCQRIKIELFDYMKYGSLSNPSSRFYLQLFYSFINDSETTVTSQIIEFNNGSAEISSEKAIQAFAFNICVDGKVIPFTKSFTLEKDESITVTLTLLNKFSVIHSKPINAWISFDRVIFDGIILDRIDFH